MIRSSLGAIAALALAAVVGVVLLLAQPGAVEAQSHSATRSLSANWALPGSLVRVTITVSNYGSFGQVVETLPEGFTLVSSSIEDIGVDVDGQAVRFSLFGVNGFTYDVTVPSMEGQTPSPAKS